MTKPRDIRRPRRTFPPEVERQIRRENALMTLGTIVIWAILIAWFGRKLGFW